MAAATEKIQKICDLVKEQVEARTEKTYEEFEAIVYDMVCGGPRRVPRYLIKVFVGGNSYNHLQVISYFPEGETTLEGLEENHNRDDLFRPITVPNTDMKA